MFSLRQIITTSAILAVAHGQGVIIKAQGTKGSPASLGLQVNANDTSDANFISQTEIVTNLVNQCGRTLQAGNVDVGANTEDALAANQVTQVTKGSKVNITIRQVNETGAGPYTCDFDPTGNTAGATGQLNVTTTESKANANGEITLQVTMPNDLACIGASTGDVCTIRCRNANEFGGCVAVQQTDTTPAENTPGTIEAFQSLEGITTQIQQNVADLPAAVKALSESGDSDAEIGTAIVDGIQAADPSTNGLAQDQANAGNTANTGNTGNNNNNNNNNGNGKANGNGNNRGGNGNNRNGNANGNANTNANANGNANGNTNANTNGNAANGNANGNAANGNANGNAANGNANGNNGGGRGGRNNNNNNNRRRSVVRRRRSA
ncbi:hypothetical protein F5Y00DRAFT_122751 [Daldinia vernicosa]|uniref:uncharacterized protein n=1 Tax=Daldinia vernicosa TaxID=114800 RepID=UPI0020078E81|nr:uncharacterized protein F5Y00DRAFT_122751 [Daldinia vernicosa]KAI0847197.1 hypothetical protein F5Y00DRAFT_122751 [Daldinia vernicosa]